MYSGDLQKLPRSRGVVVHKLVRSRLVPNLARLHSLATYKISRAILISESFSSTESYFKHTRDLINFIKQQSGDYFCIGVAGFPDANREGLLHLKNKVDNGADFVITQAFFEAQNFIDFRNKCKELQINVPIIPGIFLFETDLQLKGFANKCKVKVTDELLKRVAVKGFSSFDMFAGLIADISRGQGDICVHFFTMDKLEYVNQFVNQRLKNIVTSIVQSD